MLVIESSFKVAQLPFIDTTASFLRERLVLFQGICCVALYEIEDIAPVTDLAVLHRLKGGYC